MALSQSRTAGGPLTCTDKQRGQAPVTAGFMNPHSGQRVFVEVGMRLMLALVRLAR